MTAKRSDEPRRESATYTAGTDQAVRVVRAFIEQHRRESVERMELSSVAERQRQVIKELKRGGQGSRR